ncbi:MAG: TetR/AcrR family transcriptional regulator [Paracoccaceae bacterium]
MEATKSRGRPRDAEKRARILAAARRLFREHGVEGVAIERIAAEAGVSKVTVYNRFGDKEALFEACVSEVAEQMEDGLAELSMPAAPLEAALERFGTIFLSLLLSDELQRFEPAIAMEARRNPEIAKRFYRAGPGRVHAALSKALAGRAARGELRLDDPDLAAEQLVGLWQGMVPSHRRLGIGTAPDETEIARRVRAGMALFLDGARG